MSDDAVRAANQMRAALEEIREKAATMPNGGAWAAGLANLCLCTLPNGQPSPPLSPMQKMEEK